MARAADASNKAGKNMLGCAMASEPIRQVWPVRCGCGQAYEQAKFSELRLDTVVAFDNERLIVRRCHCGQLLGVWLPRKGFRGENQSESG